ncbi:intraflagellar transport protein 140-like protein [Dinothrombium tinctorium]|uniref:Intraflagellar transport protein 140-like protein n=1 Tax=Dinothrombium tinctorium TaxID=1965070 RepID=A0A3S5WGX3_9ACAR|nr:intraflagellar transport protein 140-like protein [Dinothrombium tinctorium]RWS07910.1 intraflagellar transport protein 140-like protein [Dinothrombium tinctorium]RWS07913.1 intraflagellar transport protein 140-like protein [Dinothrombium tinctorium]RWS08182.1 intraflagellar transport protein 140-like protein [Dinothrombium tinctorium]
MSKSYIEYNIDEIGIKNLHKLEAKWSADSTLLAVSVYSVSAGATIKLINENGFLIESSDKDISSEIPTKIGAKVTSFAWHIKELTLAIAWEDGDMGCFSMKNVRPKWSYASGDTDLSSSRGLKVEWINAGDTLMSVNSSGVVKIFNFDSMSSSLTIHHTYQLNDQISDFVVVKQESKHSSLYFGSHTGMIYQLFASNDATHDIIQLEHGIRKLLFYARRSRLVIITENLMLCQFTVFSTNNEVSEISKVKLSSSVKLSATDVINAIMIDKDVGLIAICVSGERVIKLWQLETGHNAAVIVVESVDSHWAGVSTLDYSREVLVAGTNNNHVIVWKRDTGLEFTKVCQLTVKGNVKHICISDRNQISCCTNSNELYLIEEQTMASAFSEGFTIVQIGAKLMRAFWLEDNSTYEVKTENPIRYLIASSNGRFVAIKTTGIRETFFYKVATKSIQYLSSIPIDDPLNSMVIHENIVYNLNINFTDDAKKSSLTIVSFAVEEGNSNPSIYPIDLNKIFSEQLSSLHLVTFDLCFNFLFIVVSSREFYFYWVFEIKSKALQLNCGPLRFESRSSLKAAKINCKGTLAAFVESKRIIVLKTANAEIGHISCNIDEFDAYINWALNEERLFCLKSGPNLFLIICSVEEMSIRHYDQFHVNSGAKFLGFEVPHLYLFENSSDSEISKQSLTEFEGLSLSTIKIMIDFLTSSGLELNQMIKAIDQRGENNEKLWTNLARISVKCRDINMGLYCVSKLKNARIVRDVKRELADNSSPNIALAVLAMNIGLNNEAEELLKASGNQFRLAKFYESQNKWHKAIDCVDKLNQKTIFYDYARYLEFEEENLQDSIQYYEKSGTNVFEVPRMLFDIDGNSILQNYCLNEAKTANEEDRKKLIRWWGQYSESVGDIAGALQAYEKANDYYNYVRLLCYTGESEKAKQIIQEVPDSENSGKEAALLHIGRHEESNNPSESISYYLSCGAINHAIRVCKNNNMKAELVKIVVNYGTKKDAKDLLEKYAGDEDIEKEAIAQLYCKCGISDKAIEYCLESRLWTTLRQLLENAIEETESNEKLDYIVSDSTLELAFDVLRSNSDIIDIIIDLLLLKKDKKSLIPELIVEYNIEINERLIEKIEKAMNGEQNRKLMEMLAESSLQQGQYITAAKIFNSIGDRVAAIKALIRTGDNERIIHYTNIARDKMVYKICANYLQTANYKDDSLITKFYKKANAKEELERFLNEKKN